VLFRSLRSLTGRALAAGAASALTLTLFNAAQPTLTDRGPVARGEAGGDEAGAVDNRAPATSGSATLLHRGAEPGTGSVQRLDPRVLRAGAHWYLKDSFTARRPRSP
jgi:hypothetical protein